MSSGGFSSIMTSLFVLAILLSGCRDSPINQYQYRSTLSNLDCYKGLLNVIKKDSVGAVIMEEIRGMKISGQFDPIFVNEKYRLIELEEVLYLISEEWLLSCRSEFPQTNDLMGFRYPDKDLIIIEINKMKRRLIRDRFSNYKTYESHRIVYGSESINHSKFYFGGEKLIWEEELSHELKYEVTWQRRTY